MAYRYATVVRLIIPDPRNDLDEGQIILVEGKHEDGYTYNVLGEDDFLTIRCETVGVVGPSDYQMGREEITAWAADQDRAKELAEL